MEDVIIDNPEEWIADTMKGINFVEEEVNKVVDSFQKDMNNFRLSNNPVSCLENFIEQKNVNVLRLHTFKHIVLYLMTGIKSNRLKVALMDYGVTMNCIESHRESKTSPISFAKLILEKQRLEPSSITFEDVLEKVRFSFHITDFFRTL
jgi:hypothetical protein